MAYAKINHDALLNRIKTNHSDVVTKQLHIPPRATCALISKSMSKIYDFFDVLLEETMAQVDYVAEHDYLAYLLFIGDYDLIREIFKENDNFSEQLALLEELEKEEEEQLNQTVTAEQQRLFSIISKQKEKRFYYEQQLKIKEKAIVDGLLFEYHKQIEQDINNDFHKSQIQILAEIHTERAERISDAVKSAENHQISSEDRLILANLQKDYKFEYLKFQGLQIFNEDGRTINPEQLKIKSDAASEIDAKYKRKFSEVLKKYEDHPGLGPLYKQEKSAVKACEKALAENEKTREERLKDLKPQLDQARREVKAHLLKDMTRAIESLAAFDLAKISEAEKTRLQASISRLKEFTTALDQTDDDSEIEAIFSKFIYRLNITKSRLSPHTPEVDKIQAVEDCISLLSRYQKHLPSAFVEAKPLAKPAAKALPARLKVEEKKAEEAKVAEAQNPINKTLAMRTEIVVSRVDEEAKHERQANVFVELDDESKDTLEKDLPNLSDALKIISKSKNLIDGDPSLVLESIKICEELSENLHEKVDRAKLELLKNKIEILSSKHDELCTYLDNLELISVSLEEAHIMR